MKYLKIPFWLIWRLWFYLLVIFMIILLSPFLLFFTSDVKYYNQFWKVARVWAYSVFYGMGFRLKVVKEQEIEKGKSYMFCANHTSFLDIFILIIISKNPIVFIGKKELEKLPVFGFFYKKVCISVDRSSLRSRKRAYNYAKKRLEQGVSIAIYPEGLVPEENVVLAPFKNGAFSLAIEYKTPIVPHIYFDCKRFFSWTIFKGRPGIIRAKQCKFIETKNYKPKDKLQLKKYVYNLMYNELASDKKYIKDTFNRK